MTTSNNRLFEKLPRILLLATCTLFISTRICPGETDRHFVDEETYKIISGVWNFVDGNYFVSESFSWGESKITDGSVVIDLGSDPPIVYAPNMGCLRILGIEKRSDHTYTLEVEDAVGETEFHGKILIDLVSRKQMVIYEESMEPYSFFGGYSGPKHKLKKTDGP